MNPAMHISHIKILDDVLRQILKIRMIHSSFSRDAASRIVNKHSFQQIKTWIIEIIAKDRRIISSPARE